MALSEIDRLTRPRSIPGSVNNPYSENGFNYTPQQAGKADRLREKANRAVRWLKRVGGTGASGLRVATAPALTQVKDHVFSLAAIVCADWAAWLWNSKSGLITAAVLLIAFEVKVSSQ